MNRKPLPNRLLISMLLLGLGLTVTWLAASGASRLDLPAAPSQVAVSAGGCTPIVPDGGTVWLDHLDGETLGETFGVIPYVDSQPGLALAADLITGTYIMYTGAPDLSAEATVEFWVNPRAPYQVVRMDLEPYEPTGPIDRSYQIAVQEDGTVQYTMWPTGTQPAVGLTGVTPIPFNAWSHVALSWGPAGTRLYINGALDAMTTTLIGPVFDLPDPPDLYNFTYLNYGGKRLLGSVDEFHLSSVQRTDYEIGTRVDCSLLAVDDAYSAAAASPLVVAAPGVLENDYLFGSEAVTVTLIDGPTAGLLALSLDGGFVYTPSWPTEVVTFTYQVDVENLNGDSATVTITVIPSRTFLPLVLR